LQDPASENYRLSSNSPLIDNGSDLVSNPIDFDDQIRPWGNGYDIGAFEYHTNGPTVTPRPSALPQPQ
jgi:hypothetical protein